jgi:hypothetical protein
MNNQETYPWHAANVFAILETDGTQMRSRLYEAISAIEQRDVHSSVFRKKAL